MEPTVVTLQNLLARPQAVMVPGAGEVFFGPVGSPDAEVEVTQDVAAYIFDVLGPTVKKVDLESKVASHAYEVVKDIPRTTFLANMTGDPDAPELVPTGEIYVNKQTGERTAERASNRNKVAQDLAYEVFGGDEIVRNKYGQAFTVTHPPRTYTVPAFGQIEVPTEVADTLLIKDSNRARYMQGAIIKSRDLSGQLVPKASWSLDELRMYVMLIDPRAEAGPTEAAFRKEQEAKGELAGAIQLQINRLRKDAWRRGQLRAMNPQYRIPTQAEFESAMQRDATNKKPGPQAIKK